MTPAWWTKKNNAAARYLMKTSASAEVFFVLFLPKIVFICVWFVFLIELAVLLTFKRY
jgi:hypothetical protein